MKQLIRILIGLPLVPFVMLFTTLLWVCTDGETWMECVGTNAWLLASGQWEKLRD